MNKQKEKIRVPQINNEIKAQVFMFNKPANNAITPAWQAKTKQQLKEEFLEHIKSMIKNMKPDILYTLEEICGTVIWNQYKKSDRLSFGRYISLLVKNGELALESHKPNGENHNLYSLK
jgi:tRNA A37 N6-isopentenylltransferase MiaA